MHKREVAIIGIGSFGENILKQLYNKGMDVTIIDKRRDVINHYTAFSSNAYIADSTDLQVLSNLGMQNFDFVIVGIGQDIKASILTTMQLIELGVPNVIVKASDESHYKILKKIGAHKIINPDKEMGERVAVQILYSSIKDIYEINEYQCMAQITVTNQKYHDSTISEIDFTNKYNTIVSIIKRGEEVIIPTAALKIKLGDQLFVVGAKADILKIVETM